MENGRQKRKLKIKTCTWLIFVEKDIKRGTLFQNVEKKERRWQAEWWVGVNLGLSGWTWKEKVRGLLEDEGGGWASHSSPADSLAAAGRRGRRRWFSILFLIVSRTATRWFISCAIFPSQFCSLHLHLFLPATLFLPLSNVNKELPFYLLYVTAKPSALFFVVVAFEKVEE